MTFFPSQFKLFIRRKKHNRFREKNIDKRTLSSTLTGGQKHYYHRRGMCDKHIRVFDVYATHFKEMVRIRPLYENFVSNRTQNIIIIIIQLKLFPKSVKI